MSAGSLRVQLVERVAQFGVLVAVDREQAGEDHRLDFAVAGELLGGAVLGERDRVADLDQRGILEAGDQVADLADAELVDRLVRGAADADLFDVGDDVGGHEANLQALADGAVDDADERHDAAVRVEVAVEDQRRERRIRVADGRRHVAHDRLEHVSDALAGLAGGQHGLVGGDRETLFDLVADALGIGGRQVDLVDERDDLEVRVHRHERVGDGLRLDALRGVDHEDHALARLERTARPRR